VALLLKLKVPKLEQTWAPVSGQNQWGRAVKQIWSSELRIREHNKLQMFCDVKNWRQAYGLLNAGTDIIIIYYTIVNS
jgi:hypothetical protein